MTTAKDFLLDKDQYLGINWEYTTALNLPVLILHLFLIMTGVTSFSDALVLMVILLFWIGVHFVKLLPW